MKMNVPDAANLESLALHHMNRSWNIQIFAKNKLEDMFAKAYYIDLQIKIPKY